MAVLDIEKKERKYQRFDLDAPAVMIIEADGPDKAEKKSHETVSRDICAGGGYFYTDASLEVGDRVRIDLFLRVADFLVIEGDKALVKLKGEVLRSEEDGVAVCFDPQYIVVGLKEGEGPAVSEE